MTLSTQRYFHQIPSVKGSVPQDWSTPNPTRSHFRPQVQVQVITQASNLPLEVPINLLEWFTRLRETFCLLDYQFITEGCNSKSQMKTDEKDVKGKVKKEQRVSKYSPRDPESPYVPQPRNSPNPILLGFYGDFTP